MTISVDAQPRQLPTARGWHRIKKPSARRALTELGRNDTKRNLIFVERVLALTQEKFREKWNFDPLTEKPTATGGHYLWSPVAQTNHDVRPPCPGTAASSSATVSDRLAAPAASPDTDNSSQYATATTTTTTTATTVEAVAAEKHSRIPSSTEHHSQLRSPDIVSSERHCTTAASPTDHQHSTWTSCNVSSNTTAPVSITRHTQRKITEFGKQRKRMHSQCKFEEGDSEALGSSSSKRPAREALRVR